MEAKKVLEVFLSQIAVELVKEARFQLTKSATMHSRNRNSLSTSSLFKSFEFQLKEEGFEILANYYWEFIEGGRRAGTYPPFSAIYLWALKYKIKPESGETQAQLVYKIQRAIFKRGIQPRPFVNATLENALKLINPFEDKLTEDLLQSALK